MIKKLKISPYLLSDFRNHPLQRHQVLIICRGDIGQVKSNIENAGVELTEELNPLQILKANINNSELSKILDIPGIEFIEPDTEVQVY